jgi:hypothetical protein
MLKVRRRRKYGTQAIRCELTSPFPVRRGDQAEEPGRTPEQTTRGRCSRLLPETLAGSGHTYISACSILLTASRYGVLRRPRHEENRN